MSIKNARLLMAFAALGSQLFATVPTIADDELTGVAILGHSAPILNVFAAAVVCEKTIDSEVAAKWLNSSTKVKTVSLTTALHLSQMAANFVKPQMAQYQKMSDKEKVDFCERLKDSYGKNGKRIRGLIE